MNRRTWLWSALVAIPMAMAGGVLYANANSQAGYLCPITGETLPCPDCCPLNCCETDQQLVSQCCSPREQ